MEAHPEQLRAFSLRDTSERTNLSLATLHRMIARGDLESIQIGRRRLIPHDALKALILGEAA